MFAEAIGRLAKMLSPTHTENDGSVAAECLARLPDRSAFLSHANAVLETSRRSSPALLLIGIDEFVSVSETAEKEDCDQLRRRVAIAICQTVSVTTAGRGIVARPAPGEIAVLVDCMLSDEVQRMAEQICAAAKRSAANVDKVGSGTTVSVGIAFCLPATTADDALDVASRALDRARQEGGDRCRSIAQGGTRHIDLMQDPRGFMRVPPKAT